MSITFRYELYDILTQTKLGNIQPRESVWTESVNGGSTWSGKLTLPEDNETLVENIRTVVALGNALFIRNPRGAVPWCGYISKREWNPQTNELVLQATEWRSYLYRLIGSPVEDYTSTHFWQFTATDQVVIARTILDTYRTEGLGKGIPNFKFGTDLTGINRDLLFRGTSFRSIGTWIDSMANRDRGFDWDVEGGKDSSGLPILTFQTYFPQRGGVIEGLTFKYGQGQNMLSYEPVSESNDEMVTRVWAIGSGPDSETVPFGQDSDPEMMAGASILRFEKATTYQDVIVQSTLESYARSERQFYSVPLTLFSFTVLLTQPDITAYAKGDRCRIIVKDRWLDLDLENVRIIERTIDPDKGLAKITVDLSDLTLPDTDTNGAV